MSSVTVRDLDLLLEALAGKEAELEKQSEVTKKINKEIARLEGQVVAHLKDLGRTDYDSPIGKARIEEKWRVNMPADDMAKRELFDHLRARDIFDKFATVNANSLNALFMADWKEAQERGEGVTFSMPGIGAPKLFEALRFKLNKTGNKHGDASPGESSSAEA